MIPTVAIVLLLAATDSVAAPAADTAAARIFPRDACRTTETRFVATSFIDTLAVRAACAKLRPSDLLHLQSDSGTFVGRAAAISLDGFSGLRSQAVEEPFSELRSGTWSEPAPVLEHLDWAQIRSVEVRRNRAAPYAVRGALFTGAVALAVAGYGYYRDGPSPDGPSYQTFAALFALPAMAVSAVVGGVIGAAASSWETVYPAR